MPSVSEKQRRFFWLVKATQKGKISPKKVGGKIAKAAKSMSPQDVDDFTHGKNLPKKKIEEAINLLKEIQTDSRVDLRYDTTGGGFTGSSPIEPMYMDEDSRDLEHILSVTRDTKGNLIDPHYLEEEGEDTTDDSNINPIAKTFKQNGNFEQYIQRFSGLEIKPKEYESVINYTNAKPTKEDKFSIRYEKTDDFGNSTITVIKKLREGNDLVFTSFQTTTSQSAEDQESEIIVNKSVSFRDEIDGGKILSDILQKLNI